MKKRMVGPILVALAALSVSAAMCAQSASTSQGKPPAQTAKTPPSPSENSAAAGKLELRDVNPSASSAKVPLILKNTGATRTEDVARGAARELVKQRTVPGATVTNAERPDSRGANESRAKTQVATQGGTMGGSKTPGKSKAATAAESPALEPASRDDAVLEFQPAASGSEAASNPRVVDDGAPGKSPLKRVHGDLYGATGGAGRAEGGSVGATSKSGKTSIYIQSDDAKSKAGQPQP
jgi:hypothetical protein